MEFKNFSIASWDIGEHDKARPLWKHYYQGVKALIFVVDSGGDMEVPGKSSKNCWPKKS